MKKAWGWLAPAGVGLLAMNCVGATPDDALLEEVAKPKATQWTVGVAERVYSMTHDALQQRADYDIEGSESWRNGSSDGYGSGIHASATRGDGALDFLLLFSSYTYDRKVPTGSHKIDTARRDFEAAWFQPTGNADFYNWGWLMGIRYTEASKDIEILETIGQTTSSVRGEWSGGNTWYLLKGGYYGEARPFGKDFKMYGNISMMFGEVSGLARNGNDVPGGSTNQPAVVTSSPTPHNDNASWDGVIGETYEDQHAIAYGLDAVLGAGYDFSNNFSLRVEYCRDWMYSFAVTDTGLVTFPDNQDALFQEGTHSVTAYLEYRF